VHHLRCGLRHLEELLLADEVMMHPSARREIACGSLRNCREILRLLGHIPRAELAEHDEVLALIEPARLYALGIGWIDVHLLASAMLSDGLLWSHDRRLAAVAGRFKAGYSPLSG
jgi:hypothetical protein